MRAGCALVPALGRRGEGLRERARLTFLDVTKCCLRGCRQGVSSGQRHTPQRVPPQPEPSTQVVAPQVSTPPCLAAPEPPLPVLPHVTPFRFCSSAPAASCAGLPSLLTLTPCVIWGGCLICKLGVLGSLTQEGLHEALAGLSSCRPSD